MPMPDLTPAARALAQEYVRLDGELADPLVDEVMECLKSVCRQHFALRNIKREMVERHALEMAEELVGASRRGMRDAHNVVALTRPRG